jgi:hypothetical protein
MPSSWQLDPLPDWLNLDASFQADPNLGQEMLFLPNSLALQTSWLEGFEEDMGMATATAPW